MAKALDPISAQRAHLQISEYAARIANERAETDQRIPPELRYQRLNWFRAAQGFKLGLELREGVVETLTMDQIEAFHAVGREAFKQALVDMGDTLAGLIVGEARKGRNYFDVHHRN